MLRLPNNYMIKIISSHSGFGGSTMLFIELCKLFNENNMKSIFYGPHPWHLDKYKYCENIKNLKIHPNDYVIGHLNALDLLNLPIKCKNSVLSIHEKMYHLLVPDKINFYKSIVFASQEHMEWHGYYNGKQPKFVIPTPMAKLQKTSGNTVKIAGVIGTIEKRKQTHVSILRALKDGCEKVLIFGKKAHVPDYFNNCVLPLLSDKVIYKGEWPLEKRQQMYEMISCVYHSSTEEIACLVQGECAIVGIPFYGNCNSPPYEIWHNDIILKAWKKVLSYHSF